MEAFAIIAFSTAALVVFIAYQHYNKQAEEKKQAEARAEATCASTDLQCLGNSLLGNASVYCPKHIERHAAHSVKWTDGLLQSKFSRFRWRDPIAGSITFIGDRAEFQNGFGAMTPVVYECDLAADRTTVLEVRVREGRLP